ncbi:MAG: TrkH family potassium uptake protein [Halococcoides sp.]
MTWHVDWRASTGLVGTVLKYFSATMVVPLIVAIRYGDDVVTFLIAMAATATIGLALERVDPDPDIGPREALVLVATAWLAAAVCGAIPFLIAGVGTESTVGLSLASPGAAFESVVNALFESMSGVTTTGATVLGTIGFEQHSHAVLIWRQLIQWLGGMGIIVLMIAILPEIAVNGAELMESEAPGPELQKLTPKITQTARALWLLYAGFTVALIAILWGLGVAGLAERMTLYQAVAHGFSTLPTGGFSPQSDSIGAFSAVVQWVVIPFMVVAGVNFALFWHVVRGEIRVLLDNTEFKVYTGAIAVFVAVLFGLLLGGGAPALEIGGVTAGRPGNALRQAAFQIASLLNSTGFATADFAQWDAHVRIVLFFAMFVGGSAGSTGGGIKVVRWLVVAKAIRRQLFTTAHPRAVVPVRLAGQVVEERTVQAILTFTVLYFVLFGLGSVFFALDAARVGIDLSILEATSGALATLGNIGPGFGRIGPFGSYLFLPETTKLVMILFMWLGRLEIVPVLALFIGGLDRSP